MLLERFRLAEGSLRAPARDVVLSVGLALLLGLVSPLARADDLEAARQSFADGVKLFQLGDYEGARRLFLKADTEHHAPAIVYNLGLAEERLSHPQAALDAYEAYVAEAGESGELTSPATIAIAQIKARSTRLRIATEPAGAALFVDGTPIRDPSPATVLVTAGHHLVVAQGDGWRAEQELVTTGLGNTVTVTLARSEPAPAIQPLPTEPVVQPAATDNGALTPAPKDVAKPRKSQPDGFIYGFSFAFAPYYLLGATAPNAPNAAPAKSVVAGPMLEAGVALNPRVEFLARGFAALGPDAKPTYALMGGPGLSFRVVPALWVGATFLGGQLETSSHDERYGTDLVFGALAELGLVIVEKPDGQWLASVQPAMLLTEQQHDNALFIFPFSFGYRAY